MRTKSEARLKAENIVSNWVAGAALTGWIPGSTIFLAGANMVMIRKVADTFGVGFFDEAAVKAHLGGVAGAAFGGSVAGEALVLIPLVGPVLKAGALAGTAKLIGTAVIEYFHDESPLPD